jgi:hypothetical protein
MPTNHVYNRTDEAFFYVIYYKIVFVFKYLRKLFEILSFRKCLFAFVFFSLACTHITVIVV